LKEDRFVAIDCKWRKEAAARSSKVSGHTGTCEDPLAGISPTCDIPDTAFKVDVWPHTSGHTGNV